MGSGWLQDGSLKFNKMSDEDKKRFIEAVTGSGGKIDSKVLILFGSVTILGTQKRNNSKTVIEILLVEQRKFMFDAWYKIKESKCTIASFRNTIFLWTVDLLYGFY